MSGNVQTIIRNGELENGLEFISAGLAPYADVYERIFRQVDVIDEKGDYAILNGGFGSEVDAHDYLRSPGASYREIAVNYTNQTGWRLNDIGLAAKTDKRQIRVAGGGSVRRLDLQQDTVNLMALDLAIGRASIGLGLLVAATLTNTAAMTATQFDDPATDVLAVVDAQIALFEAQEGISPNKGCCRIDVARALARHAQLNEHWSRTQRSMGRIVGPMNKAALEVFLADLWGVDEFVVINARSNTANAGQTEAIALMWADSLVLYYDQPTMSPRTPQASLVRYQGVEDGAAATRGRFYAGEIREWEDAYSIFNAQSYDEQYAVPRVGLARLLTDCLA